MARSIWRELGLPAKDTECRYGPRCPEVVLEPKRYKFKSSHSERTRGEPKSVTCPQCGREHTPVRANQALCLKCGRKRASIKDIKPVLSWSVDNRIILCGVNRRIYVTTTGQLLKQHGMTTKLIPGVHVRSRSYQDFLMEMGNKVAG